MLEDLNPTTRCYPHTLNEAFKDSVENAQWFYPPEKNNGWRNILMGYAALIMWICLAYYFAKN
jgi:hypothetical protein